MMGRRRSSQPDAASSVLVDARATGSRVTGPRVTGWQQVGEVAAAAAPAVGPHVQRYRIGDSWQDVARPDMGTLRSTGHCMSHTLAMRVVTYAAVAAAAVIAPVAAASSSTISTVHPQQAHVHHAEITQRVLSR